jgi:hypothetical protein
MKEYGIERKIGYFTLDNASNNDTCMQGLGLELNFNRKFRRLRCAGHISLMAKQVLSGKESNVFDLEAASQSTENDLDVATTGTDWKTPQLGFASQVRERRGFTGPRKPWVSKKSETLDLVKEGGIQPMM